MVCSLPDKERRMLGYKVKLKLLENVKFKLLETRWEFVDCKRVARHRDQWVTIPWDTVLLEKLVVS